MSRNLRLYSWYQLGISFYAWMPIFFLYFQSRVSLQQVLLLESIYYACVFVVEIPSGYFSDRFGRRPTLRIASTALFVAYLTFVFGTDFPHFAVAQCLLAVGLAFNSGSDTVFHLDTLTELGLEHEYGDREAKLSRLVFFAGAASALTGGVLGALDLRLAYVASAVFAALAMVSAFLFVPAKTLASATTVFSTLQQCVTLVRQNRWVAWVSLVWICAVVVNHLPYEFYQPFLRELARHEGWALSNTPVLAGLHACVVQLLGAVFAGYSVRFSRRFGIRQTLVMSVGLQALVTASMLVVSPTIALVLALRALPKALQDAPMRQALAPLVSSSVRATYLSMLSLFGRLGFAGVLLLLSSLAPGNSLEQVVKIGAIIAAVLFVTLGFTAVFVRPESPSR